jgi:hypothetical protein
MTLTATCHCGGTRIEVPDAPTEALQCNCTYCTKSGGVWSYWPAEAAPRVVQRLHDAVYSASDGMNQHHFCAKCGCTTYGVSPDYSDYQGGPTPEKQRFALNIHLLDDFDASTLKLDHIDGRNMW